MDWKTYLQTTFLHEYFVNAAEELENIYAGEVNKEVSEAMFELLSVFRYEEKYWTADERYEKCGKEKGISRETWEMVKHSLEDVSKEKIEDLYYFFVDIWMVTKITERIIERMSCTWEEAIQITDDSTVIDCLADGEDMRDFVYHYSPYYWSERGIEFREELKKLERKE